MASTYYFLIPAESYVLSYFSKMVFGAGGGRLQYTGKEELIATEAGFVCRGSLLPPLLWLWAPHHVAYRIIMVAGNALGILTMEGKPEVLSEDASSEGVSERCCGKSFKL